MHFASQNATYPGFGHSSRSLKNQFLLVADEVSPTHGVASVINGLFSLCSARRSPKSWMVRHTGNNLVIGFSCVTNRCERVNTFPRFRISSTFDRKNPNLLSMAASRFGLKVKRLNL